MGPSTVQQMTNTQRDNQGNLPVSLPSLGPADVPAELKSLGDELRRRFAPDAAAGQDLRMDLDTGIDVLVRLRVKSDQLALSFHARDVVDCAAPRADVRFYFPSPATGRALLLGEDNAIDAFMRGDFRSDGYLMLAFQLMAMFNSTSLPPAPND